MLDVLVVDRAPEIGSRLCARLRGVPEVHVIGCADNAEQALALAEALDPDVVVLDVALRRGCAVLRHLVCHRPRSQVIVLSDIGGPAVREGMLRGGARACFDKAFELGKALDWVAARAADKARGCHAGRPGA